MKAGKRRGFPWVAVAILGAIVTGLVMWLNAKALKEEQKDPKTYKGGGLSEVWNDIKEVSGFGESDPGNPNVPANPSASSESLFGQFADNAYNSLTSPIETAEAWVGTAWAYWTGGD